MENTHAQKQKLILHFSRHQQRDNEQPTVSAWCRLMCGSHTMGRNHTQTSSNDYDLNFIFVCLAYQTIVITKLECGIRSRWFTQHFNDFIDYFLLWQTELNETTSAVVPFDVQHSMPIKAMLAHWNSDENKSSSINYQVVNRFSKARSTQRTAQWESSTTHAPKHSIHPKKIDDSTGGHAKYAIIVTGREKNE